MAAADGAVLTFRVADRRLAVDASEVSEVVRQARITRVPHAPAAVAGVTSLRGEVAAVVALGRLLDIAADASGASAARRLVVLKGSPPLALAVDEVMGLAQGEAAAGGLMLTEDGETRVLPIAELLERQFAGFSRAVAAAGGRARAAQAAAEIDEVGLLGFVLAGQPYALPLEQVREVLALPEALAALPSTDAAMLGVINRRGALLPVVSTRVLLGLPAARPTPTDRVVVVAIGESRVGLVVDQLTSVLRAARSAVGPVPSVLNRGAGEAHIDAMLRTPEGGLVSVLAPERLFRDDSVAQILADGRQKGDDMTQAGESGGVERFLVFTLGEERYGLPIEVVEEVAVLPDTLTRVPGAPAFMAGVMSLRGQVLPVVDQRRRFDAPQAEPFGRPRVVIARIGDTNVGFAVDAVTEILAVAQDRIGPTPALASEGGRVFDRVAQADADGGMILLVDPGALLERAEADLLAEIASRATRTLSPPS